MTVLPRRAGVKDDNTVISATTGAATYDFYASQNDSFIVTANNLAAADTIDIQVKVGSSSYTDLYEDGTQVQLTNTWNGRRIVGPGQFRINKGSTTNSVSIHID